jgi:hypothetical protein
LNAALASNRPSDDGGVGNPCVSPRRCRIESLLAHCLGFDLEAGYCAALSERIIDPLRQLAVSEARRFRRSAMPHGKPFGLEVDDFEACLKLVLRK